MRLIRLAVVLTITLFLAVPHAEAQPAVKIARIGYLAADMSANPHFPEAFRQGLRDHGYVEGQNVVIEYRSADGHLERLPKLAAELVRLRIDVLVSEGTPPSLAAKQATETIPIVFGASADAVGSGLVASLARPGGNITGLSFLGPELVGKSVQLLKEVVPGASRLAVLWHPGGLGDSTQRNMLGEVDVASRALSMRPYFIEARSRAGFDKAFSEMRQARVSGLTVLTSLMFFGERKHLVELAAKHRLPTVYPWSEPVVAGGLMAYGPYLPDLFRRTADFVDKILKGAKPADLPVEQPTKFELVINLKTAKALGLTIPQSVLLRADQVIQ
jgi:putative tryptophan/tyrosine transport system substrate-binding protein